MSKPDAPTPPNPYQTAAAQTGTNVATGVANSFLNNINQRTPQGSLNYDVTGSYSWTDPSTGHAYNIPRFTSTQTLSPSGQALQNQNEATQLSLAQMAGNQANRASGILSTPFNPTSGGPAAGNPDALSYEHTSPATRTYDAGGAIQTGLGDYGKQQSTFGDAGDVTRSYGAGDFSQDRQNVEDALMARINPQLAKERGNIEQRLADQGIRYGSQAYTSAMDDYNRQATDTRFGAIGQAGTEQQRMMDMAAKRAGFENSAQQQAYEQAQGRGSFANEAQAQNYNQMLGAGSFANQAQAQQNSQNAAAAGFYNAGGAQQLAQQQSLFNARNSARNQYMQEQYQQRNQPLNEIAALMSGSQVQQPNWLNSPTSQIATTDIGGLINQNFAQQQQNYQTATSSWNATMGGLLGLGAGAIKSDRRAKKNIDRIGSVFAVTQDGERQKLPVYEWEYRKGEGDSGRHVGPMAQDVERIDPGAVREIGGVKHIDAGRVMGGILRAA